MFKNIGFFLKDEKPTAALEEALNYLKTKDVNLFITDAPGQHCWGSLSLEKIENLDLIISFGGDGTILQLSDFIGENNTPILGVNQGKIGFLTSIKDSGVSQNLEKIIFNHKFKKQSRIKIECTYEGKKYHAVNEIVIKTSRIARIGDFTIEHEENGTLFFRADGIIISTATGSTGYNLAAGGPILPYCSDLFVLTPICPHKYHVLPIILPQNKVTNINIIKDHSPYGITFDGQRFCEFNDLHKSIVIKKSTQICNIIYPEDFNYYDLLQKKLNFGGSFAR